MSGAEVSADLLSKLSHGQQARVLVLDGAYGTELAKRVSSFSMPEELLIEAPDVVLSLHRDYIQAGADIIETNTFGANRLALAEVGLHHKVKELNLVGAELAREAASSAGRPTAVAGSVGPTPVALSLGNRAGVDFSHMVDVYKEQIDALVRGGVDLVLVETVQDLANAKAALVAWHELGRPVPVAVSFSLESGGRLLSGHSLYAAVSSVAPYSPIWIGLNCAFGPKEMIEPLRKLAKRYGGAVAAAPNAGVPDPVAGYSMDPESMLKEIEPALRDGLVNLIGGCCGTGPRHIELLAARAASAKPRPVHAIENAPSVSGFEELRLKAASGMPVVVGERSNVQGSKKFKKLMEEGEFEAACQLVLEQVQKGADAVDLCLVDTEGREAKWARLLGSMLAPRLRVPLMIDTTDPHVAEILMSIFPARPVLNSVSFEDRARAAELLDLAVRFGAAVVLSPVGLTESGLPKTAEEKLEGMAAAVELAAQAGLKPQDLLLDPLVFPQAAATEGINTAFETLEAIRRVRKELGPYYATVAGISNVSYGLPRGARKVVNAAFLKLCAEAGLDVAIVSPAVARMVKEGIERRLWELALRVLLDGEVEAARELAGGIYGLRESEAGKKSESSRKKPVTVMRPEDALSDAVLKGLKDQAVLSAAEVAEKQGLVGVAGIVASAMKRVGELFEQGKLLLTEVLLCAEAASAAMARAKELSHRGQGHGGGPRVLLATVKGDVHDIGKNLAGMLLEASGFEVVDLGVRVPAEVIVSEARRLRPVAVGLSGLLARSAREMVETAKAMADEGIDLPLVVGGAVLNPSFVARELSPVYRGEVHYAKDAVAGVEIVSGILARSKSSKEAKSLQQTDRVAPVSGSREAPLFEPSQPLLMAEVVHRIEPNLGQLVERVKLRRLAARFAMGGRGVGDREMREAKEFLERAWDRGWIRPKALCGRLPVTLGPDGVVEVCAGEFRFLWKFEEEVFDGRPAVSGCGVGCLASTCGVEAAEWIRRLEESGSWRDAFMLSALAAEAAEVLAGLCQEVLGGEFRLSFGYSGCPGVEHQVEIVRLLGAGSIGLGVTETGMLVPEQSVTAVVFGL